MIIQALARLKAKYAAQKNAEASQSNVVTPPVNPTVVKQNVVDAPAKPNPVAEVKKLAENVAKNNQLANEKASYSPLVSFKKSNQRIAHVPKTTPAIANIPPKPKQAKKRGSCSPPDTTIVAKSAKNDALVNLLTPPSVSPSEPIDEPVNHAAHLIQSIVSWDAFKIMNRMNQRPMNVHLVPPKSFGDFIHHERLVRMFYFSPTSSIYLL